MRLIDADALILSLQVLKAKNHKQWGKWENEITDAFIAGIDEFAKKEAQPQRRKGKWIHDGYDIPHGVDWMHCSVCGRREPHVPAAMTNYCPGCGAEMETE